MEYREEDFLMLSGIQHFAFCRRQWALIHIDQLWEENSRTMEGQFLHEKAHDAYSSESRRDVIISRAVPVFSRTLGASGECDIVEFRKSKKGVPLHGRDGLYEVYPVEYKRGAPKDEDMDILQLAAQAVCLEEMLGCEILQGAVFYAQTRRRLRAELTEELKSRVRELFLEMHTYAHRGYVPKAKRTKACNACSMKDLCLPALPRCGSAKAYVQASLNEPADGGEIE